MKLHRSLLLVVPTVAMVMLAVLFGVFIGHTNAASPTQGPTTQPGQYKFFTFFSATTTSATSTNNSDNSGSLNITGAKRVVMYFQRGGLTHTNLGTSTFTVQISPDWGTTWYTFGQFISATSSSQVPFPVDTLFGGKVVISNSITGGGTGTTTIPVALDLFKHSGTLLRCIEVTDTDGESTCKAFAEY